MALTREKEGRAYGSRSPEWLLVASSPLPTKSPPLLGAFLFFFFSTPFLSFSSLSLRFTKDPCMGHLFQNFCPDL